MYVRNVVGKQPGEILENFSNCLLKCCTVYIHWKFALIRDTEKDDATQGTLGWSTCRPRKNVNNKTITLIGLTVNIYNEKLYIEKISLVMRIK